MTKLTTATVVLASITTASGMAMAGSSMEPCYIGARSANPEQETFAYVIPPESQSRLAFIGPAHNVGAVTGDAERDTIAYLPLIGVQRDGL
jgi:hypothetical protein